jgi:hypothetical protein
MQSSLPAGWLAFSGRESNPLNRSERFQITSSSSLPGLSWRNEERVRLNGGRHKKKNIVALARKLLVALWKYVTSGVVIEGAVMKTQR